MLQSIEGATERAVEVICPGTFGGSLESISCTWRMLEGRMWALERSGNG